MLALRIDPDLAELLTKTAAAQGETRTAFVTQTLKDRLNPSRAGQRTSAQAKRGVTPITKGRKP